MLPTANDLLIEIMHAVSALADGTPEIVALATSAVAILTAGVVTPEQEAQIRTQLDAVKGQIDAA